MYPLVSQHFSAEDRKCLDFFKEKFKKNVTSIGHNLAISAYAIRSFLDEHNIEYLTEDPKKKDREEILSKAKNYTIALECWGTKK